jgi:Asp-tRNA(Asn)/Glu-tRNA(Gln) amidotransferase C subunit
MPITEDQVRLLATLAGMEITPGQMPGVIGSLETVLGQAALLFEPPMSPLIEPAPVFVP